MRHGVADRLLAAAATLAPHRLRLAIFDGWRSPHLQQTLFHRFCERLRRDRPILQGKALDRKASRYVSEPTTDPNCLSPHLPGGGVDLTLGDDTGILLPMGTV